MIATSSNGHLPAPHQQVGGRVERQREPEDVPLELRSRPRDHPGDGDLGHGHGEQRELLGPALAQRAVPERGTGEQDRHLADEANGQERGVGEHDPVVDGPGRPGDRGHESGDQRGGPGLPAELGPELLRHGPPIGLVERTIRVILEGHTVQIGLSGHVMRPGISRFVAGRRCTAMGTPTTRRGGARSRISGVPTVLPRPPSRSRPSSPCRTSGPAAEPLPGVVHLPGWLDLGEQQALVAAFRGGPRPRPGCATRGCPPAT